MVYKFPTCPKCGGILIATDKMVRFEDGIGRIYKCEKCGYEAKFQEAIYLGNGN